MKGNLLKTNTKTYMQAILGGTLLMTWSSEDKMHIASSSTGDNPLCLQYKPVYQNFCTKTNPS
jgi:hypothetical protein